MRSHSKPKVLPMMSRNRLVAIALAAMMLATAVVSLAPAANAQDTVPTKPTVPLVPLPNLEQRLYLRHDNAQDPQGGDSGRADCASPGGTFATTPAGTADSGLFGDGVEDRTCPVSTVGGAVTVTYATAADLTPWRTFNITGNNTFSYIHRGAIPDGIEVVVTVLTGSTTLATGKIVGFDDDTLQPHMDYVVDLNLTSDAGNLGRAQVFAGQALTLQLTGTSTEEDQSGLGLPGSPTTLAWAISDQGSYLEVRAQDAVRAATWITDERDQIRDIFAPIASNSFRPEDEGRRIVGHFALQSAFGFEDASTGPLPEFQVFRNGIPSEVGPGGKTIVESVLNQSASAPSQGLAVWTFEPGLINYRGLTSGEYAVRVDARTHTGAAITRGIEKVFAITSQSVELAPFADPRAPGVAETQAHTVLPGDSTTYLLAVTNRGNVNDTFTINVSAPNAPAGWGAQIGGPDVASRRIVVPANETRILTLTVTAPFTPTGQVIHLVNVTSVLDPGTRSRDLTLVTSIGTDVVRDISVVFLPRDLSIEPGIDNLFSVYVWNRGTRVANASLEVQGTISPSWRAQLLFGDAGVGRIVISGIQPGDIGEATLKVVGPTSNSPDRQTVRLNATNLDNAGVARDLDLLFTLRQLAGVRLQILSEVGTATHIVETSATSDPSCNLPVASCDDDGVDGVWFRTWITNTGRATDTFTLSADTFGKASGLGANGPCTSTVFPAATDGSAPAADFGFYARGAEGTKGGIAQVTIPAGNTSEVYAFLRVDRTATLCPDDEREVDFFSFIVQATSASTGALGRAAAEAIARDGGESQTGVFLESVSRTAEYTLSNPVVDIRSANTRLVSGPAEPGSTAYYRVRLTNLGSWGEYTDNNGAHRPVINVSLLGTESETDWNISLRQVKENANDANYNLTNPFTRSVEISNLNARDPDADGNPKREAWFDTEIEVRVETPANGSAAKGSKAEFQLLAQVKGRDAKSTLEMATIIADKAIINVSATPTRALAHPGEPGAFLLTLSNVGGSTTTVTLQAAMNPDRTTSAQSWQVSPNSQSFSIAPFTNRTVALLVTPPAGASQGQTGEVALNITYFDRPDTFPTSTARVALNALSVDVVAPGTLQLTAPTTDLTIPPGGTANFTMSVRNAGSLAVPFSALVTPIPNWSVDVSPSGGTLQAGENRTLVLILRAPLDVKNDTRFSSVVTIEEVGATNNFDSSAFNVNILGGKALPRINVPTLVKRVDRDGVQQFEVAVQNVGTAAGRLPLEVRSSDPSWIVGLVDQRGNNITGAQLGPNEIQLVNVTVRAPFTVPERAVVPVEIIAYSQDLTQAAKATLSAEIHDYGVQIVLDPASKEGLPGVPTEFVVRVKNTGNDNDTLNLSVNLVDLPEWSVDLSSQETRLEPGQEVEVRATLRSPTTPLPAARAYTFPFWVGTRGGQEVNISKNMTVGAVVTIPNYRSYDLDKDGQLEVTVDLDRRAGNGFEEFREVFTEGLSTQVVADPIFDGRTTFFLDVPRDRPYDGVADVWFNPETVHAFEIVHAPDVNGDGTPDYLLDTNRDGKMDKAFDSATERFWDVFEVKVFGDDRIQYLIDTTGDGRPDRFFDPEANEGRGLVTRTQGASDVGADLVGIDVDDDESVDYYYNTRTQETSGAEVQNVGSFAKSYWYFFVVFAALVLLTVLLIVRRRKNS